MSDALELIRNAQVIRKRLLYPPNAVKDKGINLRPQRIPPKVDINTAIERFLASHRPVLTAKVTIMSIPPEDFEPPMEEIPYLAIRKVVCRYFHIKLKDFLGKSRIKQYVFPRQIAFYLGRIHSKASMPEMGRLSGHKDHTTILHGYRKIKAKVDDGRLADMIKMLEYELFSGKYGSKRDLNRPAMAAKPERDLAQELPGQGGSVSESEVWCVAHRSWLDREGGEATAY